VAEPDIVKVLLVEDDEDDYILTQSFFEEIRDGHYQLEWIPNADEGLEAMVRNEHDICLVDYRLGACTGIELLSAAQVRGCKAPIILLTGQGEHEIDLQAMKAGAADYLIKGRLDARLLERSVRYALERRRAAAKAAADQARLAEFGANVGLALTRRDSLDAILQGCAAAMVRYFNCALARIWTYEAEEKTFRLHASDGPAREASPAYGPRLPKLNLLPEALDKGQPLLINDVLADPRLADLDWARREGIVAFAGYPLVLEERLVGLMTVFARQPLREAILEELSSVANGVALCIERKRSEEALGASEFKYRSVVENVKEVIFQLNERGQFAFLNPAWTSMTGFKVKETLGTPVVDYLHPDDRDRHWELFQQLIQRQKSYFRDETRYVASDGTFRWVEVYAQPTLDTDALGTSGTLRDITERKRAEAEIQKLAAFVQFNPDPVLELVGDGTLTYANPAAQEMARTLGLKDVDGILPGEFSAVGRECLRLGQHKPGLKTTVAGRTLTWSFFPIVASQVVHCYGSDITDQMTLEAQLRHAQKLESVGQLAAGVAHDFNNILTIIQGHSDRLLERPGWTPDVAEPLQQISAAANRATALTRQLLVFSRKQVMQPRVLDLSAVLGNLAKMLRRLLGDDIALESIHEPGLPAIEADAGMVEQIIMNLSVNARDAMPKGGRLTVSTATVTIDEAYVRQQPEARPGSFVCLSVTDTGCGMSKETLARIFEPFFTTKDVGKGTGLGLATVYGIVKQHQGWAEVSSQLGVGTTFRVYFPASTKPLEVSGADRPASPQAVRGRHETILLVEDEPVLRELARTILKDYDYEVIEAATGVEALQVWEAHGGKVDLLLTDMVMPEGMSGRELAEELKSRKPDLRVIYTSGYSSEVMGSDLGLRDIRFLQKPYPPAQLAHVVRDCLDVKET
jgi:PAS domain S-box-containing protein